MSEESRTGRIWWSADSSSEAEDWKTKFLANGAIDVRLEPEEDRPVVHVYITLKRSDAKRILGYEPGAEEWLNDLSDNAEAVYDAVLKMAEQHGLKFDADGIRDTVESMARQLSLALPESEVVQVCDEVLANQKPGIMADTPSPF